MALSLSLLLLILLLLLLLLLLSKLCLFVMATYPIIIING